MKVIKMYTGVIIFVGNLFKWSKIGISAALFASKDAKKCTFPGCYNCFDEDF